MDYTLIDPEADSNMDYSISESKYNDLPQNQQDKYEPAELPDEDEDY